NNAEDDLKECCADFGISLQVSNGDLISRDVGDLCTGILKLRTVS
ncbi:hypothetical protein AVEN_98569-1, partial [Araneus ventricosus]